MTDFKVSHVGVLHHVPAVRSAAHTQSPPRNDKEIKIDNDYAVELRAGQFGLSDWLVRRCIGEEHQHRRFAFSLNWIFRSAQFRYANPRSK
jgi:hypothetical protein